MLSPTDIHVRHFSTFTHGGAARAAVRLHSGIQNYGVDSNFVYHRDLYPETNAAIPNSQQISFDKQAHLQRKDGRQLGWFSRRIAKFREKRIHRAYDRNVARRPEGYDTFSMAKLPYPTPINHESIAQQVVHLHWISFFLDYPTFFASIPDTIPLVWTLHDMNSFTGGCHFATGCDGFKIGCGRCPQLDRPNANDVSWNSFSAKRRALLHKQVYVVSPSEWLLDLSRESPIWPASTQFHKIHYGLDLKEFFPVDRYEAGKSLNLATDKVVIAFGAENLNDERKGTQLLIEALKLIQQNYPDQVEVLLFGNGQIEASPKLPRLHQRGFVKGTEQLRNVYSRADVLVLPSKEDNQPQIGLESMACGTPVVAFKACGIPEFVRHEETGLLAKPFDSGDLAKQLIRLVNNVSLRSHLSASARQMMEMEFEIQTQSWNYLKLYRDILKTQTKGADRRLSIPLPIHRAA